MNIVKLQNELKNVPDQALIGYVQNPTGQVPTYLALAELQRRKDMREKYQQQQAPATTVADDLKQQAQPSGLAMLAKNPAQGNPTMSSAPTEPGVAGLPTGDMYQPQNFATGGIVAFDDGGYVLPSDYDPEAYLSDYQQKLLDIPSYVAGEQFPGEGARKAKKELQKTAKTPYDAAIAYYENLPKPMIGPTPTYLNPENVLRRERDKWFEQKGTIAQDKKLVDVQDKKDQTQKNIDKVIADSKVKPVIDDGNTSPYTPKQLTLDEAIQQQKDAYKKMGVESNFYEDQAKKLQEQRDELAKDKTQAGWMALARAGLGMAAGKSPFALQNIAEGATMGLEDYNKAKDKLESAREKQFDLQARMAQAQRAEQIAAATHGLQSEEHIKAQNHADKLAELG